MSASKNIKIAIFSIFITPQEKLNKIFFDFIIKNYKHFIILGDLNAKIKLWHCKTTNPKGILLEQILIYDILFVLNNKTSTFQRSKSIIDLTICSNSLHPNINSFKVLPNKISDHQPTLTTFNDLNPKKAKFKSKIQTIKSLAKL